MNYLPGYHKLKILNWRIILAICFTLVTLITACDSSGFVPTLAPTSTDKLIFTPTGEPTRVSEPPTVQVTPTLIPTSTVTPEVVITDAGWWKEAVFYQIFVRSFYDSDGNGIGDFKGIIQKLDYLNDGNPLTNDDLGINALWLMPIMPSPTTHGYDVTDYDTVNPQYGSMEDFKELLTEAQQRGIRVILDLPLNHTSSEHPWFLQSQDPDSPYRTWYIWSETNPGYLGPWNQVVWHPLGGHYYYGYFWSGMPDLNYTNNDVTQKIYAITDFWLNEVGVDGFRLDAIGAMVEENAHITDTNSTHAWWKGYNAFIDSIKQDAFTVGESWNPNEVVVTYLKGEEMDLAFNFDLSFAIIRGINENNPVAITDQIVKGKSLFPESRYGVFVTNHDMERVITQLGGSVDKAKAAASIYLTIPGVPFIYYGEELGMGGVAPDEQCRLPMQWSDEMYAGFSTTTPWRPPQHNYLNVNVESQLADPNSLLSHYRKLITFRMESGLFGEGEIFVNSTNYAELYSSLVVFDDVAALVIVNLSDKEITDANISINRSSLRVGTYTIADVFESYANGQLFTNASGGFSDFQPEGVIPGYGTKIFMLNP
jgi:alpha-amylase